MLCVALTKPPFSPAVLAAPEPSLALPGLGSQASLGRALGARGLLQTHSLGTRCLQLPPSPWLSSWGSGSIPIAMAPCCSVSNPSETLELWYK